MGGSIFLQLVSIHVNVGTDWNVAIVFKTGALAQAPA